MIQIKPIHDNWVQKAATSALRDDIVTMLLNDKRSENTRRAYKNDLTDFLGFVVGGDEAPLTPQLVADFLQLDRFSAIALVTKYKAHLMAKGLAEATLNRRLAAIKSLVRFARIHSKCNYTLEDIKGEKVIAYRDTTGVAPSAIAKMMAVPNTQTLVGKRDYAILRLLWDNALRRSEVIKADIKDLDLETGKLWILGKGKGTQKESIELSSKAIKAIQEWLLERKELDPNQPLFIALDRANYGHRLSDKTVYRLVKKSAQTAGIQKSMSPHKVRHSAITASLDANNGNIRKTQKLSRHAKPETVIRYDDNRQNYQGEMTNLLADLV